MRPQELELLVKQAAAKNDVRKETCGLPRQSCLSASNQSVNIPPTRLSIKIQQQTTSLLLECLAGRRNNGRSQTQRDYLETSIASSSQVIL